MDAAFYVPFAPQTVGKKSHLPSSKGLANPEPSLLAQKFASLDYAPKR
jgi:hypothetical protein